LPSLKIPASRPPLAHCCPLPSAQVVVTVVVRARLDTLGYSAEQHVAASRFAALRWSDRFVACDVCRPHLASLPGRAEVPTVPVGARHIADPSEGEG